MIKWITCICTCVRYDRIIPFICYFYACACTHDLFLDIILIDVYTYNIKYLRKIFNLYIVLHRDRNKKIIKKDLSKIILCNKSLYIIILKILR